MKRKLRLVFFALMIVVLGRSLVFAEGEDVTKADIDMGIEFCKQYPVSLELDGNIVTSDVPPVIIKGRTMIPVRALFESMGATVNWNNEARLVEISLGSYNVTLVIDSKSAFVNGSQKIMDVPAMIIGERTLIPVRFVAESLACNVDWNDLSRTVVIKSDANNYITTIDSISVEDLSDKYRVIIEGAGIIDKYKTFAYDSPDRFGIDIKNTKLVISNNKITSSNKIFSSIRYSQFEEETVRIVVDLKEKVAGKISSSEDRMSLYIDFDKDQQQNYEELGDVTVDGLEVLDWRATGKLIVIDPGHGGKDTGSQGIQNGVELLNEKDINLDIATRLNRMLLAAGANTYMLREDDTYISLYGRPELANSARGDLYISVHNNSSDNRNANGTEVYYYSKTNECDYGIYSMELAMEIQSELIKALGTKDRGAKSQPAYAVLNKTQMPAIIIEGAFISNTEDLKYMLTDEFRERYAYATAKSIIKILNDSVKE